MAENNFNECNKKDASNSSDEANEAECYYKYITYRQLLKADYLNSPPRTLMLDRHNYFKNLDREIKADAMAVLDSPDYNEDFQRQAMDMFKALKITPRVEKFPTGKKNLDIIEIDTDCGFDLVFTNIETKVYQDVLSYFRDILD